MLVIFLMILITFLPCEAQYQNCDYTQTLSTNVTYTIATPTGGYGTSTSCRWIITSPEYNILQLSCSINIPQSTNCGGDRLSVSTSGDPAIRDARHYCGVRSVQVSSWDNKMSLVLRSTSSSSGGNISCTIRAVQTRCNCGWQKTVRIVGGTFAQPNEFPMYGGLVDGINRNIVCGVTIIAKRYFVTAAHCTLNRMTSDTFIVVGEHDVDIGTESSVIQLLQVEYFRPHELFDLTTQQNDIALVKTIEEVLYSGFVGPACLPLRYQSSDFTGITVDVMGWGSIGFGEQTSPVLKKTRLVVQSQATCEYYYSGRVTINQICTYAPNTDSCQNDSGGPLLWLDPSSGAWNILGVISYSRLGCATNNPAVNTNVAKYIQWIMNNTPGILYCSK